MGSAQLDAKSPLRGKLSGSKYISPTGAFQVTVPVLPELGGTVTDTATVVTFGDDFKLHISIAAFPQDSTQRWELSARGTKDYLIYFFTTFVLPDFVRRFEGASIEDSARFIPTINDGALLVYTLLPGGSMFTERAALPGTDPKTLVAKRGNLLFLKNDHIFVISTELAERVLERNTKRTPTEENDLLRRRLTDLLAKMEFTAARPTAKK